MKPASASSRSPLRETSERAGTPRRGGDASASVGGRFELDEEAFLDLVFERALLAIEDPGDEGLASLMAERPELAERVRAVIELARRNDTIQPVEPPAVPGYEVLREIGRGAMGRVYLARREELGGRPVALKVLAPGTASPSSRARFLNEARALAKLDHPHIVRVLDVLGLGETCVFAMDWIEGVPLSRLIEEVRRRPGRGASLAAAARRVLGARGGDLPSTWTLLVCRIGIQIGRALAEVERSGLLHRDVKPSNVLIRRSGDAVLSDFGLVRDQEVDLQTRTGEFLGTIAYSSPEQLRGRGDAITSRSDLYALGATLYHAVALRPPLEVSTTPAALDAVEGGRIAPLRRHAPGVPRDLETVISRAMDPLPAKRYASGDELADDLERLVRLEPVHARGVGFYLRTLRWAQRNRRSLLAAGLGAGVVLVVTLAAVYFLWFKPNNARDLREQDQQEASRLRGEARLALLDPAIGNRVYFLAHPEELDPQSTGTWPNEPPGLSKAVSDLERAAQLCPEDVDLGRERDVVVLAQALWNRSEEVDSSWESLRSSAPRLFELGSGARWPPGPAVPDAATLAGWPREERDALGLLATLCGSGELALAAYAGRPRFGEPDALADGLQGFLFLARDDPVEALLRLREAVRAAPEAGYLAAVLADALARVGGVSAAREVLARARVLGLRDPFEVAERVRADILALEGRVGEARELYEILCQRHVSPTLLRHHAEFLESLGERERALVPRLTWVWNHPRSAQARRELEAAAEAWWQGMQPRRRREVVRQQLDGRWPAFGSLTALTHQIGQSGVSATVPGRGSPAELQRPTLRDLVDTLEALPMLPHSTQLLPGPAKDFLALALTSTARHPLARAALYLGAVYLIHVATVAQTATSAKQQKIYDFFGSGPMAGLGGDVAAPGDLDQDGFDDLLIGEFQATVNGLSGAGQVRVISGRTGTVAYLLQAQAPAQDDFFGVSVDAVGDLDQDGVSDIVVGAYQASDPNKPGFAEVRSGATGALIRFHVGANPGDDFGGVVVGLGDVDGDTVPDYAIGAEQRALPGGGNGAGYAIVYSGSTGTPCFSFTGAANGDGLTGLRSLGDINQDGLVDLAAIALQTPAGGVGYVQIHLGTGPCSWTLVNTLTGSNTNDFYGIGVQSVPDVTGDGVPELTVGACGFDPPGKPDAGRLFAYSGSSLALTTPQLLWTHDGDASGDKLGYSPTSTQLAGQGPFDIAVGAPYAPMPYLKVLESKSGNGLQKISSAVANSFFGGSIAAAGDVNGDCQADLVVGSPTAVGGCPGCPGTQQGSAHVFSLGELPLVADAHVLPAQQGGTVNFCLDADPPGTAGPSLQGKFYFLLGALGTQSASCPPLNSLPLTTDALLLFTLANPGVPPYTANFGILGPGGLASASLSTGPLPGAAGMTLWHAYVVFDLIPTFALLQVSTPVPLTIQ